ncbi:hypothetical protein ABI59_06695 [Acidobacteria bacterium Mor1]|nr:hypothetical protein ABI59_06695 [Acidobacteria bacterium Mor1]
MNPLILTVFGTRPELIKLAPVIRELEAHPGLGSMAVSTSQHTDLLEPFLRTFEIGVDHDLQVMTPGQSPAQVTARVLERLSALLTRVRPAMMLVQGDTASAMAAALAGFYAGVPVGHVEAGLRTEELHNPFPEEMHRRVVGRVAALHFAATKGNRDNLLAEGIEPQQIHLTGNPVVDALKTTLATHSPSSSLARLLQEVGDRRLLVLTTHRRESFGDTMRRNLEVLRDTLDRRDDIGLVFPVHPNPAVQTVSREILGERTDTWLVPPMDYPDFVHLLSRAWMVLSDSGGIQEEVPSLGRPLLILRSNTERPEVVNSGFGRLVGDDPAHLARALQMHLDDSSWVDSVAQARNPFGDGRAAERIAGLIAEHLERLAA